MQLRTRNCRKFIKNVLPEKCKENMQTKQPRFKLQLKKTLHNSFSEIFSCNDIRNGYIMKVVFESNCKVDYESVVALGDFPLSVTSLVPV